MPGFPRPKGKATKIAYRIMGVPGNMKKKKSDKTEKRLTFEDTYKVR